MTPGSMPVAREIFQEGLIIPPIKLARAGSLDQGLLDLILANVRLSAHGKTAGEIFANCCPGVTLIDLGDAFSQSDAGEAGAALLAQVRNAIEN